jgi:hypothetical protein
MNSRRIRNNIGRWWIKSFSRTTATLWHSAPHPLTYPHHPGALWWSNIRNMAPWEIHQSIGLWIFSFKPPFLGDITSHVWLIKGYPVPMTFPAKIWNRITGNTGPDAQVAQAAKFNEIDAGQRIVGSLLKILLDYIPMIFPLYIYIYIYTYTYIYTYPLSIIHQLYPDTPWIVTFMKTGKCKQVCDQQ